jgi:hypothetical protein
VITGLSIVKKGKSSSYFDGSDSNGKMKLQIMGFRGGQHKASNEEDPCMSGKGLEQVGLLTFIQNHPDTIRSVFVHKCTDDNITGQGRSSHHTDANHLRAGI